MYKVEKIKEEITIHFYIRVCVENQPEVYTDICNNNDNITHTTHVSLKQCLATTSVFHAEQICKSNAVLLVCQEVCQV